MLLPRQLKDVNDATEFARNLNEMYSLQLQEVHPDFVFSFGNHRGTVIPVSIFRCFLFAVCIGKASDYRGADIPEVIKMALLRGKIDDYIITERYSLHPVPLAALLFCTSILGIYKMYSHVKFHPDFSGATLIYREIGGRCWGSVKIIDGGALIPVDEWMRLYRLLKSIEFYGRL